MLQAVNAVAVRHASHVCGSDPSQESMDGTSPFTEDEGAESLIDSGIRLLLSLPAASLTSVLGSISTMHAGPCAFQSLPSSYHP